MDPAKELISYCKHNVEAIICTKNLWVKALSVSCLRAPMKSYADSLDSKLCKWNWCRTLKVKAIARHFIDTGKSQACMSCVMQSGNPEQAQKWTLVLCIPLELITWKKISWSLAGFWQSSPLCPRKKSTPSGQRVEMSLFMKNPLWLSQTHAQWKGHVQWALMKHLVQEVWYATQLWHCVVWIPHPQEQLEPVLISTSCPSICSRSCGIASTNSWSCFKYNELTESI